MEVVENEKIKHKVGDRWWKMVSNVKVSLNILNYQIWKVFFWFLVRFQLIFWRKILLSGTDVSNWSYFLLGVEYVWRSENFLGFSRTTRNVFCLVFESFLGIQFLVFFFGTSFLVDYSTWDEIGYRFLYFLKLELHSLVLHAILQRFTYQFSGAHWIWVQRF